MPLILALCNFISPLFPPQYPVYFKCECGSTIAVCRGALRLFELIQEACRVPCRAEIRIAISVQTALKCLVVIMHVMHACTAFPPQPPPRPPPTPSHPPNSNNLHCSLQCITFFRNVTVCLLSLGFQQHLHTGESVLIRERLTESVPFRSQTETIRRFCW